MLVPVEFTVAPVACTPPKVTESARASAPKFRPEIVTRSPTAPRAGKIAHTTGDPGLVTVRPDEALWLSDPLVAANVTVPDTVQSCVATVMVTCTAWFVEMLTEEAGLKLTPVNGGGAGTVRLTVPVKPFKGVTVAVYAALAPAATAAEELAATLTLKSGVAACTFTVTEA
jgi:hypothetical protein